MTRVEKWKTSGKVDAWRRRRAEAGGEGDQRTHGAMSEQVRDPSKAAKARQRGLTVLERLLAEETAAAEKEEARRLSRPRRALSVPRAQQGADKDANGGEGERGRGRQRINESGQRADGADVMQLQRRSRSLMSKKNWRRKSASRVPRCLPFTPFLIRKTLPVQHFWARGRHLQSDPRAPPNAAADGHTSHSVGSGSGAAGAASWARLRSHADADKRHGGSHTCSAR